MSSNPGVTALLGPLQRGLCRLYRVATDVDVGDYLIDEMARRRMGLPRLPREQLLVRQEAKQDDPGEVEIGLFIDEEALRRLEATPRARRIGERLGEFCLVLEGVSHFVYLTHRAREDRPVSALELELQAEIDKYVTCVLETWEDPGGPPADLRPRLFERFELDEDLSEEERERYLTATREAAAYARSLEGRYVRPRSLPDMLVEIRRVWRLGYHEKLDAIRRAA